MKKVYIACDYITNQKETIFTILEVGKVIVATEEEFHNSINQQEFEMICGGFISIDVDVIKGLRSDDYGRKILFSGKSLETKFKKLLAEELLK